MDLPRRIGRYEIRARIATGATSEVLLARAAGAPDVALKRLHPHLAEDADAVALLLDEARLAARLDHPAAVSVVDLGCDDGTWFVAFEHVPGRDLGEVIRRLGAGGERLPPEVAVAITVEIASALDALHALGDEPLVHGDVSPANVLVSRDGAVRLVDLGACAALARGAPGVFGTPGYVAPEQARGESACPRADVFSAGAILFELLTGEAAYTHDPLSALAAPLDAGPASRLSGEGVPRALAQVVATALAPDAAHRHAGASELVDALSPFAATPDAARAELAAVMRRLFGEALDGPG